MKNYLVTIALVGVLAVSTGIYAQQPTEIGPKSGHLTVRVVGFKHDRGQFIINIFSAELGFPSDRQKAIRSIAGEISNQLAVLEFSDLPPDTYAISALHDENGNGKVDTNFIGIPKEPSGTSRDAKGHFGPPKFRDATFALGNEDMTVIISLH